MSEKSNSTNQSGYDIWSEFYDSYPNPTVAVDELFFSAKWRHLSHRRVLEIGCGTGRHTVKLVGQGNDVVGIDVSDGMLNIARKKLEGKSAQLIHGDFLTYPFADGTRFDAAVASLVLEHIKDLDSFFAKLATLISPGGEVFISDIHPERSAQGILAHFKTPGSGDEIHLDSRSHAPDAVTAKARAAGFALAETDHFKGNEQIAQLNPKWSKHLGSPMVIAWTFQKMA